MLRCIAAGVGATASVTAAQMWHVKAKFRLAPDALGPRTGEVEYRASNKTAGRLNIVFLGDSLVMGVGCSTAATDGVGPVLPRRAAESLAVQLGATVRWVALGETGADVSGLALHLPALAREAVRAAEAGERVDAVVIMTGLNDIKECVLFLQPSKHPGSFRDGLSELLGEIRGLAGADCVLLMPNTPLEACPRFNEHWPLSLAVRGLCRLWEVQKRAAVEGGAGDGVARFVEAPPELVQPLLFSADGMHPNDAGYTVWADLIAQKLRPILSQTVALGFRPGG